MWTCNTSAIWPTRMPLSISRGRELRTPSLREKLCADARVAPNQVHPLFLGLGADLAIAAAHRGETLSEEDLALTSAAGSQRQQLVDRLLRYVDADTRYAVRAVGVCRAFDTSIYRYLSQELRFGGTRADFEILTTFSFVRHLSDGQFRVHDLLRRIGFEADDEFEQTAHEAMERYFRDLLERGDEFALVDAIYHANRVDWQRGAREWLQRFDTALRASRFDLCDALLEIRDELVSKSPAADALLAIQEADYLHRLARYDEARAEYDVGLEAIDAVMKEHASPALNDRGNVLAKLGNLEQELGNFEAAEARYSEALSAFAAAIEIEPFNYQYLSNRGSALVSLGDLKVRTGTLQRQGQIPPGPRDDPHRSSTRSRRRVPIANQPRERPRAHRKLPERPRALDRRRLQLSNGNCSPQEGDTAVSRRRSGSLQQPQQCLS